MDEQTIYCDLNAIPPESRAQHSALAEAIFESVTERLELANGYRFHLPINLWQQVAAWALLERLCCPFFDFRLDLGSGGAFWLSITGVGGVKALLRAEMGIEDDPAEG